MFWWSWLAGCTPGGVPVPSSDATLRSLQLAGAELRPSFDPETTAYMVGLDELSLPLHLEARAADPHATVDLPQDRAWAAGERLEIDVTSADGSASRTYTVLLLPEGFPEPAVSRPGEPSAGSLYLAAEDALGGSWAMRVDPNGVPEWLRASDTPIWDLRRGPAGEVTLITAIDDVLTGLVVDPDTGEELARFVPATSRNGASPVLDVHEFELLDDGSALLLGNVTEGDLDLSPLGGPTDGALVHTVAQQVAADGSLLFEWTTAGAVDLQQVPIFVPDPAFDGAWVYTHTNSVAIDPDDGNLVVSLRIGSQILKVATHDTQVGDRVIPAGAVVWRLGGTGSDFRFVGDDRADGWTGFAGQHSARPLGGGRLAVFDNALRREATSESWLYPEVEMSATGAPRFVEYALDPVAGTATLVAEHAWPNVVPIEAGGSVQRLPDGHTVIGWGNLPTDDPGPAVTEIDAAGDVVLELTLPEWAWSYRAWKFE